MKKDFEVYATVTISIFAKVRAENEEEAKAAAESLDMPLLCIGCSSQHEDGECWGVTEFDGEPNDIRVES